MPIYEYRCAGCHEDFEVTQKITDQPLQDCPKCHGKLEKQISQTSFVLKGGGWYMTDYARKGANKGGGETPKGSGGGCGQSGSKPACSGCSSSGD